jgi:hypothetical protein
MVTRTSVAGCREPSAGSDLSPARVRPRRTHHERHDPREGRATASAGAVIGGMHLVAALSAVVLAAVAVVIVRLPRAVRPTASAQDGERDRGDDHQGHAPVRQS